MARAEILGEWDVHFFMLSALVTIFMQLFFFTIAYLCKFDLVTDLAGSTNFILLAVMTLVLGGNYYERQVVCTALVTITRLELALFLLYRVYTRKSDARFDDKREDFVKFLCFWVFQMIWAFACTSPIIFLNAEVANPPLGTMDYVAWLTFGLGFVVQVMADVQKYRFRNNKENNNKFITSGVWAYSRHPNYFGEIVIWWSLFVAALPAIRASDHPAGGYVTIASPLFTMLILLFLSGIPTGEGQALSRYHKEGGYEWETYRKRTPPLVLFPPCLYEQMPMPVKRIFCFEFKQYEYNAESANFGNDGKGSVGMSYGNGNGESIPPGSPEPSTHESQWIPPSQNPAAVAEII